MDIICPICGWRQTIDSDLEHYFRLYQDNEKYHPFTCINSCGKMQEVCVK